MCTRNETALTSDCNSLCPVGRPCVAYANGDEAQCGEASTFGNCTADDLCTYECFATGPNDFAADGAIEFSTYTFLIPFADEPGAQELNWTDEYPSKANDILQQIEPLDFMTATTSVVLAGGSSVIGVRGDVARVQLPEHLLTADTQLESVTLANFGLEQVLNSSLPSSLINLTISNCLMTSYPEDLKTMSKLENLDLSQNYFSYFPEGLGLRQLQTLNMSANSLASLECSLLSLLSLDIADNNFTYIPATIFEMPLLRQLDLRGNDLTGVTLSTTQFEFLQGLELLSVDSFKSDCTTPSRLQVGSDNRTINVCVSSDESASGGGDTSDKALIAGITAAAIVLLIILIIIGVFRCLRRRALRMKPGPEILSLQPGIPSPAGNYPYARPLSASQRILESDDSPSDKDFPYDPRLEALRINPDDLEYIRRLSSDHGSRRPSHAHRVTYLTRYRGARLLVCKRLQAEALDETVDTQHFTEEVKLAAILDHPRIVALVGIAWTRMYGLEAIFEYMDGGNLRSYLVDLEDSKELRSWRSASDWKLQVALDVAEALAYAHSFSPVLVHRDLTSHSVLLSSPPQVRARLDDFVESKAGCSGMSTIGLSLRDELWMPPEVIMGVADYSTAGDVYALGVIISEIDTHSLPYDNVVGAKIGSQRMSDVAILDLVASGKLRPAFSLGCPTGVRELADKCLSYEPSDRPTALQAVIVLRTLMADGRRSSYSD